MSGLPDQPSTPRWPPATARGTGAGLDPGVRSFRRQPHKGSDPRDNSGNRVRQRSQDR